MNSLTGPAMLTLPATFARSGIIPTTVVLIFVCFLAAMCSLHIANTISKVPNNLDFQQEVEFSEVFRSFWGTRWFYVSQLLFFVCVTCLNISSIVDTAQVVDTFFGHWMPHGGTAAFSISPEGFRWIRWDYSMCTEDEMYSGQCIPFADEDGMTITVGSVVTACLFMPMSLMDLKENAYLQVIGFFILLVVTFQFIVQFIMSPGFSINNVSWWGEDWTDLFGVVLFNFALVIAIPAWLYERDPNIDVPYIINRSSAFGVVLYISVGCLACMAMPNVAENMLQSMMSGALGNLMQFGASIFAFAIIGLGIPLFSVFVRLNLTSSKICSRRMGNVLAVYLPFVTSLFMNDGTTVTKLLSWGGTIFTSLVAFILPLLLAIYATEHVEEVGSIDVYGGWLPDRNSQLISLRVLLGLAVVSVAAALFGNIWDSAT